MNMINKVKYVQGLLHKHGVKGLVIKVLERKSDSTDREYQQHFMDYLASEEELRRQKNRIWDQGPKISVVVPAYETPELFLRQLIDSLMGQSYRNWELCIADGSTSQQVEQIVRGYMEQESRIVYKHLEENAGISGNTNQGFAMATGDYIGLLDHDDLLAPNALYEVAAAILEHPGVQILYSDEDKVNADATRHMYPHFKLDYNPQLLLHYNYVCHFLVVSAELLHKTGGLDAAYDGSQDYDFVLRCTEQTKDIVHIPKILYHWRVHAASTAGNSLSKDYAYEAGKRAVQNHLEKSGNCVTACAAPGKEYYQLQYNNSDGRNIAGNVAICSPDSIKVITRGEPLDYILVLGDGVRNVNSEQLRKLYGLCSQPGVGIVGGKIYNRKRRVVSCGLTVDGEGHITEKFAGLPVYYKGYFRRAVIPQNAKAVSLDFCLIKKEAWKKVGGPNMDLDRPMRDVEYAKRMRQAGYEVLLNPQALARLR